MTFQFKITLKDIEKPAVWRQLLVPEQFTFLQFHKVLQASFGWKGYHLFHFAESKYGAPYISTKDPDGLNKETIESHKIKLTDIFFKEEQKFVYVYDFGDDWVHQIRLEKILDQKTLKATCLAGTGACPPEDCGGPFGYEDVKKSLKLSGHPKFDEIREWLRRNNNLKFDINEFDLEKVNTLLKSI